MGDNFNFQPLVQCWLLLNKFCERLLLGMTGYGWFMCKENLERENKTWQGNVNCNIWNEFVDSQCSRGSVLLWLCLCLCIRLSFSNLETFQRDYKFLLNARGRPSWHVLCKTLFLYLYLSLPLSFKKGFERKL